MCLLAPFFHLSNPSVFLQPALTIYVWTPLWMEGIKPRLELSPELQQRLPGVWWQWGGGGAAHVQMYILSLPSSARVADEPERIGGPEVTR